MNLFLRNPWLHMLGRRGLQVVALALIIGTLCFFMVRALPGDLAMRVAASRYGLDLVSGAAADTVRAELGLDQSAWQGLLGWWRDMATFIKEKAQIRRCIRLEEEEAAEGERLLYSSKSV